MIKDFFDRPRRSKTFYEIRYVSNRGYDDFGRLKELNLHKRGSANYMQSIDYRYNEKGQLTHINNASLVIDAYNEEDDDVFGQELMYHQMSPEAELQIQTINYPEPDFNADYNGNISGMIWNVKTPDEDGAETNRHLYTYQYDDLGQLIEADYGMDHPSDPGQFNLDYGRFSANYNYDLGGNITRLQRRNQDKFNFLPDDGSGSQDPVASTNFMDDLIYTYRNDGFLLDRVDEGSNGMSAFSSLYSHFTDGAQQDAEYTYDQAGRNTGDLNKEISTDYNSVNRPSLISGPLGTTVSYIYDAAGNKLQKIIQGTKGGSLHTIETDYIGNLIYEYGELKMIYHPEGVVRLTPEDSENETEYVYDYFIKDYLGNVRVVLTGENATEEVKFLATMEEVHRLIESENFDNLDETAAALPSDYPVGGSVELNERIAYILADGEMTIGPSLVTPVRKGETVKASIEYFYEEDAPGATYDNLGFFVDEILVAFASSAAGVIPVGEATLNNIASGNTPLAGQLYQFLANNIDTTDMSRPHGYLVYVAYDNRNQMIPANSGALQVTDPNQLRTILTNDLIAKEEGFFHIYVSNGSSAKGINFDNFLVTLTKGKTRQINHYYPYGLPIAGIDGNENDWPNKYTGKEHQTGEFMQFGAMNRGVEMFDFDARFFEPQLARWVVPDPAEQFSNPYLGIGNNPIMYKDPDGEWVHIVIGAAIGGTLNWAFNGAQFNAEGLGYFGVGALAGGLAAGVGAAMAGKAAAGGGFAAGFAGTATIGSTGFVAGAATGAAAGVTNGLIQGTGNAMLGGQSFGDAFVGGGLDQAWKQGLSGAAIGGIAGGIQSTKNGGGFFESGTVKKTVIKNDIRPLKQKGDQNCLACAGESMAKADGIDLTQEQIRNALGGDPNLDPLYNDDFGTYFARKSSTYYGNRPAGSFNEADIFGAMNEGSHVVLSRQSSSGVGHALVLKKAVKRSFNFATSVPTQSYKFRVMNPSFGTFERLNWGDFNYRLLQWTP